MGQLLQLIAGFFAGDTGAKLGAGVANATALAGLLAAVAPVAIWFGGHKDETLVIVSYGDAAFWLSMFGGFVFAVVKVAHYARSPGS